MSGAIEIPLERPDNDDAKALIAETTATIRPILQSLHLRAERSV